MWFFFNKNKECFSIIIFYIKIIYNIVWLYFSNFLICIYINYDIFKNSIYIFIKPIPFVFNYIFFRIANMTGSIMKHKEKEIILKYTLNIEKYFIKILQQIIIYCNKIYLDFKRYKFFKKKNYIIKFFLNIKSKCKRIFFNLILKKKFIAINLRYLIIIIIFLQIYINNFKLINYYIFYYVLCISKVLIKYCIYRFI